MPFAKLVEAVKKLKVGDGANGRGDYCR